VSFAQDSTRVFLSRIILVVIIFATDVALAQLLGPSGKGYVALLVINPVMLAVITGGGLDFALNCLGLRHKERKHSIFSVIALMGFGLGLLVAAILLTNIFGIRSAIFQGIPAEHKNAVLLSSGIIPVEILFMLSGMLAITLGKPVTFAKMRIIRRLVVLVSVGIAGFLFYSNVVAFIFTVVFGQVAAITCGILFGLIASGYRWERPYLNIKEVLKENARAYLGRVAERFETRISIVMLGLIGTGAMVGKYTVATCIAEAIFMVSNSIATVLFSRSTQFNRNLHDQAFRLMVPIATIFAVIIMAVSTIAIPLIYGEDFSDSVGLLFCLLPGVVAFSLVQILTPSFVHTSKSNIISLAHSIGLVVNISGNIILVPWLGAVGASLASSGSFIITLVVLLFAIVVDKDRLAKNLVGLRREDFESVLNIILPKRRKG